MQCVFALIVAPLAFPQASIASPKSKPKPAPKTCLQQVRDEEKTLSEVQSEQLSPEVAIVWFPKTWNIYTTTNIESEGIIWGTQKEFERKGAVKDVKRASVVKGTGYYRFQVKASPQQIASLNQILHAGEALGGSQSCVRGTCLALKAAGIINIPFPFNQSPILNAAYLGVRRFFPGSKIVGVSYVGVKPIRSILLSKEILFEGAFTANLVQAALMPAKLLIALVIQRKDGKQEQVLVPVESTEPDAGPEESQPSPSP